MVGISADDQAHRTEVTAGARGLDLLDLVETFFGRGDKAGEAPVMNVVKLERRQLPSRPGIPLMESAVANCL